MKTRIGIVIHTPLRHRLFSASDWARLATLGEVVATESAKPLSAAEGAALLADCQIAVGSWDTPGATAAVVPHCPELKLWIHAAGTVKAFFGPHLDGRDLRIASCKAAIAQGVAELVLGQIIVGLRRSLENAAANRAGPAPKPTNLKTLPEAVIGLVSASETSRHLIALLRPFGCRILVWDPFLDAAGVRELGVEKTDDLVQLCADSDVVSLHAPSIPETYHLLGAKHFKAMRDDVIFINSSRGSCLDEAVLIAELSRGRLFAFLDVTDPEPAVADSPLRSLPNILLTSHLAGPPSILIGRQVVDDIAAWLGGGSPRHVVTTEILAKIG